MIATNTNIANAIVVSVNQHGIDAVAPVVADYLARSGKSRQLDEIMRLVSKQLRSQGIEHVKVTAAHEPEASALKTIEETFQKLTGAQKTVVDTVIDPNLLGGIVAETAAYHLDTSVRTKLRKLKSINA